MAVVNVIVIHGIGDLRGPDAMYSLALQRGIRRFLGTDDPEAVAFFEVNWSDIGDREENALIRELKVVPPPNWPQISEGPFTALGNLGDKMMNASSDIRRFLLTGVGDALIYLTERGRREIQERMLEQIHQVRESIGATDPHRPRYVSIIAHSLGSVIAYDVAALLGGPLREQVAGLGLSHFFTMGSPLALFSLLEYRDPSETHYRTRGVHLDRPENVGAWLNFYDQQDPLACLLERLYPPQPEIPGRRYQVKDIRVETGTFRAHVKYWENETIARAIAAKLRQDYESDREGGEILILPE